MTQHTRAAPPRPAPPPHAVRTPPLPPSLAPSLPCLCVQDPRFLYVSLDEASTHVGATAFRLVAAIYTQGCRRLLATSVSPPVK